MPKRSLLIAAHALLLVAAAPAMAATWVRPARPPVVYAAPPLPLVYVTPGAVRVAPPPPAPAWIPGHWVAGRWIPGHWA